MVRQSRLPLRLRLSLITAGILLVAVSVASFAAYSLLQRSLITQVDEQLRTAGASTANQVLDTLQFRGSDEMLPSDYYLRIVRDDDPAPVNFPATTEAAVPEIPDLDDVTGDGWVYWTVSSVGNGPSWRVAVAPLEDRATGAEEGAVAIALPLTNMDKTLTLMRLVMVGVGAGVVVMGAIAGYIAVQRSLRGLRDIENTAAAVAGGDLSRRVPAQPTTTEVGRLGASFNSMVAKLEASFAAQTASEQRMRRFVSDASHELRTPLASIRGYGELYRMGAVPPDEVGATMRRIENESIRMGNLVADLLALARLDEGRALKLSRVNLTAVASDALADLRALDPTREGELLAAGPLWVEADSDRVRQVVTNLIGNVVQHTPEGTPVEIAVHAEAPAQVPAPGEPGVAVIEVRDHGPGIRPEDGERVFERFYRPDSSRARNAGGGSGLGLAIVATIVAAHGGTVRHRPTPGGGTTIVVRLPIASGVARGDVDGGRVDARPHAPTRP
ncbi:HAMP domain-containing histidine kinase [Occultella glacieicola]|uniref:histidine kinase n=1 Tax=Occultella glacieicola TaxID=2518684 RepID=A0ABY2E430_9MICO|nr:HAMP domain-containing sensor histidine kinase [Occultella glacieicola]TDE94172.1 HAMP domain-containing histidine kinase [Occultella glacieicola]